MLGHILHRYHHHRELKKVILQGLGVCTLEGTATLHSHNNVLLKLIQESHNFPMQKIMSTFIYNDWFNSMTGDALLQLNMFSSGNKYYTLHLTLSYLYK